MATAVGGTGEQGAAALAVAAGEGGVGGVHPDRLAHRGAGGPDLGQGRAQHRVGRVELAAQRQRQVPGADVDPVHPVDGQRGRQVGDGGHGLHHDQAERLLSGQRAARGPVTGGRVTDRTGHLTRLRGGVHVGHDHALAAQIQGPADVGRVRVPDPAHRCGPGQPDRGGHRGQVGLGGPTVLKVDDHVVEPGRGQQPDAQQRRDRRPRAVQGLAGGQAGAEVGSHAHGTSEPQPHQTLTGHPPGWHTRLAHPAGALRGRGTGAADRGRGGENPTPKCGGKRHWVVCGIPARWGPWPPRPSLTSK